MVISGCICQHSHHLHFPRIKSTPPPLPHPHVPLIHDPQGCLRQTVMGLCQVVVAAPASAPARPRPGPSTALICSHSSSRQSVKHWGKIFCLPEQLLINCPFIDAQDKFCLLSFLLLSPSPPYLTALFLAFTMLWISLLLCSLRFSETGTLALPLNKLQACQGYSSVGQSSLHKKEACGKEKAHRKQL